MRRTLLERREVVLGRAGPRNYLDRKLSVEIYTVQILKERTVTRMPSLELGCHSEYGRLDAVVVGRTDGLRYPALNRNIRYLTGEIAELLSSAPPGSSVDVRARAPHLWEQLTEAVERVADTFTQHGVSVLRPRPFAGAETGYLGELQEGASLLYPADPVYVLGKHVIETCIRRPFRRKEAWATRAVLQPFIDADLEVRHVASPRAELGAAGEEGAGPFLEGGDIIVVGRDVLCGNTDLTSNAAGSAWLRRYLEPFGYRVHPVAVTGTWLHLLGVLCLLREGLAMAYLPALGGVLPAPIADWDVIEITEEEARMLATVGMNLDAKRHLIDARLERVIAELQRHGMEPVPIDVEHLSAWGGAVRCVTLPIARAAA
jgi:N-dimethylarginine dimethylaminohydrolase